MTAKKPSPHLMQSGGFLMLYAADTGGVRDAQAKKGLDEMRFKFGFDGSTILVRE
jgi:hypothetical protein